MKEFWYWTELIGFDVNEKDFGVKQFIDRVNGRIHGVSLLLYDLDFVNTFCGYDGEKTLPVSVCSYAGHPFNEERARQAWREKDLKKLVSVLHGHGVKVVFSVFNFFSYYDENGNLIDGAFGAAHPEIWEMCSRRFVKTRAVHVIKRLKGGGYYEDVFTEKTCGVINAFGFDGIQLSDGLSSTRQTLQEGDFSDDLVEQFTKKSGITLPADIKLYADDDKEAHIKRYKYIFENLRWEYTKFISERFSEFFKKLSRALCSLGKLFIINNAWTRNGQEALLRYGTDYRALKDCGVYAIMMEDVGGSAPLFSEADAGGVRLTLKERRGFFYEFSATQQEIKAALPDISVLNMSPIKDTMEGWNLIDNAPTEVIKYCARRNSSFIIQGGKLKKACGGAWYCLSDGISREKWEFVQRAEDITELAAARRVFGYAEITDGGARFERECREFTARKRILSSGARTMLAERGAPIVASADIGELKRLDMPAFIANPEFLEEKVLAALEKTRIPLVLFGKKKALERPCCITVTDGCSKYRCDFYGFSEEKEKIIRAEGTRTEGKRGFPPYERRGGLWTLRLEYEQIGSAFLRVIAQTMLRLSGAPFVTNRADCTAVLFETGEKRYRLYVFSDSYFAENTAIKLPVEPVSVTAAGKPFGFKIAFKGNTVYPRVANRGAEVLDIVAK